MTEERYSRKWYLTHRTGLEGEDLVLKQARQVVLAPEIAQAVYADFSQIAKAVQTSLDELNKLPPLPFQQDEIYLRRALNNLKNIGKSMNLWGEAEVKIPRGRRPKGLYT